MAENSEASSLNPQAMTPAQVAGMLSRGGELVTAAMIDEDLAAGAPANRDGTINLVQYAAWLARELRDGS